MQEGIWIVRGCTEMQSEQNPIFSNGEINVNLSKCLSDNLIEFHIKCQIHNNHCLHAN